MMEYIEREGFCSLLAIIYDDRKNASHLLLRHLYILIYLLYHIFFQLYKNNDLKNAHCVSKDQTFYEKDTLRLYGIAKIRPS